MASTATFDETLFPHCPTAITPPGTAMDDENPHDQEGPHGTPGDEFDNHPSNSNDQHHSHGPPSPDPKSPSGSFKDELKDDDIYRLDVASEHSAQDTAAHDPPSSTPPALSREPSVPRMPIRPEHMVPNWGDHDEWDRLP